MLQPSVRMKAMADQDQQKVWDEVGKSRAQMAAKVAAAAPTVSGGGGGGTVDSQALYVGELEQHYFLRQGAGEQGRSCAG